MDKKVPPLLVDPFAAPVGSSQPTSWGAVPKPETPTSPTEGDVSQLERTDDQPAKNELVFKFVGKDAQARLDVLLGRDREAGGVTMHQVFLARSRAELTLFYVTLVALTIPFVLFLAAGLGWLLGLGIPAALIALGFLIKAGVDRKVEELMVGVRQDISRSTVDGVVEAPWQIERRTETAFAEGSAQTMSLRTADEVLTLQVPEITPGRPGLFEVIGPCRAEVLWLGEKAFLSNIELGEQATLLAAYGDVDAQTDAAFLAERSFAEAQRRSDLRAIHTNLKLVSGVLGILSIVFSAFALKFHHDVRSNDRDVPNLAEEHYVPEPIPSGETLPPIQPAEPLPSNFSPPGFPSGWPEPPTYGSVHIGKTIVQGELDTMEARFAPVLDSFAQAAGNRVRRCLRNPGITGHLIVEVQVTDRVNLEARAVENTIDDTAFAACVEAALERNRLGIPIWPLGDVVFWVPIEISP